jgi:hypothetical protein
MFNRQSIELPEYLILQKSSKKEEVVSRAIFESNTTVSQETFVAS